jgi:cellulose synthase/poly-beta-1,6-N-acetylglucosamine synthase-like glycosyltransferase
VIPAYNVEKIIKKSIESIFNSDYPKSKIHVIAVNDGSTDNTLKVLENLRKKYPLTIYSKKNEGRKSYAINYGLKRAKTEFIAALDADTLISRDLIKKSIVNLQDTKIAAVICNITPSNKKNFFEKMQVLDYAFTSYHREILRAANSLQTTPAFAMFRKSFLDEHGLYDSENITEDLEMGLRIQKYHYDLAYISDSYAETDVPNNFSALRRQRLRWGYGLFYNLSKYHKLFSPKYGDFGVFFLPSMLIGVFLLLGSLILAVYNLFSSSLDFMHFFSLGWRPSFFDITGYSLILSISEAKIILSAIMLVVALTVFIVVKKDNKDVTFIDYIEYLLIYSWILAYFYILCFFSFILRIKPKW